MSTYIGLDTSNYTTSVAALQAETEALWQFKQLLPVKEGELGLRQSDAVFHHVRQLPDLTERLCKAMPSLDNIGAIGVSDRPQEAEGSYMPCFLVGVGAARQLAAATARPLHVFTHQQGHVAAALYGSQSTDLFEKTFLAFHVSGGTTDALLVKPHADTVISCEVVASSLDLKAGQLVDRVGGMLGLPFPAGPALDKLAQTAVSSQKVKPVLKDENAHFSGVENQCRELLRKGIPHEEIALFCLRYIQVALEEMTARLLQKHGDMPVVYAGGVMSNTLIRAALSARFGGRFAPPEFSSDNAVGIAVLTAIKEGGSVR
ncbi:MAG: peptidase M22 [Clostridia bacterium]|nr:peptidase M22 [Clostridia bacterium]